MYVLQNQVGITVYAQRLQQLQNSWCQALLQPRWCPLANHCLITTHIWPCWHPYITKHLDSVSICISEGGKSWAKDEPLDPRAWYLAAAWQRWSEVVSTQNKERLPWKPKGITPTEIMLCIQDSSVGGKQAGCVSARNSRPNIAATRRVHCCTYVQGATAIVAGDTALIEGFQHSNNALTLEMLVEPVMLIKLLSYWLSRPG